ncbi:35863_t:CDS:2 [Gigaspora margarita]|uniref:35863_t:CDS:1 n=1 Tax=Gigaspora margarita TaxID=4874 RepID=A0ABN7V2B1_GIGMA|nr:35863_t:CDS:2 [Gigaspora margarita]
MRHIDTYICWFPSDFNDNYRILSTDWESDYNGKATLVNTVTPLLNSNNFPKGLNIHYNYNVTKPEQDIFGADWVDTNNSPRSYIQEYNQGLQLLLQAMIPQPGESSVGATLYKQQKATNYFSKNKVIQFSDKKGRNKPREWVVFNVHDGKCLSYIFGEGKYPRRSNTKYCKHYTTNTHTKEDCYLHRAKEVDEPIVFYAQKNKWQQRSQRFNNNNIRNNYRRKQVYNTETIEDKNISKYQEYQEYLKAKQAYLASIQKY